MADKLDRVYERILDLRIVTFKEIGDITRELTDTKKNPQVYQKYIRKLLQHQKLDRIRRGLYAVLSPLEKPEYYKPDKFLLASKIRKDYYIGYHSALEIYGTAYSLFNEVYIAVKKKDRFDAFKYKNLVFKPVFVQDTKVGVGQKEYLGTKIRISSKERTFLDCLDRVDYAGGWEEALKSLQNLGGLNFNKLRNYLVHSNNDFLCRKSGFVLELLKNNSIFYENIDNTMLDKLGEEIGKEPRYFSKERPRIYNKRWNLYVPKYFEEKLRGI